MPYKNIVYAKLEKRLLHDWRWFTLDLTSQLIYIKLILCAQETYNRIPKDYAVLCDLFHVRIKNKTLLNSIDSIKRNFPKFKESENYYYFEDFQTKTNYVQELPNNAEVAPKGATEKKRKEKENNIVEEEEEKTLGTPADATDEIEILFRKKWQRNHNNLPELMEACNLVKEYGMERVEKAFHISAVRNKTTIPYVRGILNSEAKVSERMKAKLCVFCGKETTTVIDNKPVCNFDHLAKYNEKKNGQQHK